MAEIYDWFESKERRDILIYVLSMSGLPKSQGVQGGHASLTVGITVCS